MKKLHLPTKLHRSIRTEKKFPYHKLIGALVLICIVFNSFSSAKISLADGTSGVNVRIDYIEEVAVITAGSGGSTRFYMSTDKKNWEVLGDSGIVDVSNIISTKQVTIYFKGNKDTNIVEYPLAAEDKSLVVTFKVVSGAGIIAYTSTSPVEYKKGEFGTWKTAPNNMSTAIYEIKGATLYYRTPATTTKRAGKIVTVKIPKRPTAPSVKLDGGKLSITGLKQGETQYRVGDSTNWVDFTSLDPKSKSITLQSLLSPTSTGAIVIPAGRIELRTKGNDKKLDSSIKVIEFTQQPIIGDNITLTGTTLKITDTDTKKAYEYTRVEKGKYLDLNTAKWTSITSKTSVIVPNASVGDKILVRLKSTIDPTSKQPILASTYKELVVMSITTK